MDGKDKERRYSNIKIKRSGDLPEESFLRTALRHRWTILMTTLFFLGLAIIYLVKATPIYTPASRIYVEQSAPRIIGDFDAIMTNSKNYLYTQAELMKSTPIITDVIEDPQIKQFRIFDDIDNPHSYLKKELKVDVGRKDDIITISFDAPNPEEAVQIVNKTVNSYIDYQSRDKRRAVSEIVNLLQREKIKRDRELKDKFDELLDFTKKYGIVSYEGEGNNIAYQELTKLADALTDARLASVTAASEYEVIKGMARNPEMLKEYVLSQPSNGIRIVSDDESKLRIDLAEAQQQYEILKERVTSDHPAIQAMHDKIMYIKEQIRQESANFAEDYLNVAKLRYSAAQQREQELQVAFETQKVEVKDEGVRATEYLVIKSELKRLEENCDTLDNRIKELSVAEDSGALNISILEVAHIPDKPSSPQKAKILLLGLMLGMMTGSGLAVVRDWLDPRIRSAEEISAILGINVLGTVPRMPEDSVLAAGVSSVRFGVSNMMSQTFSRIRGLNPFSHDSSHPLNEVEMNLERRKRMSSGMKVENDPQSTIAEAYRTIRTAVFFGGQMSQVKTILVTSPAPGDGKSTLVSNLAITMAHAGQRTLIIDADFRKPTQHKIFGDDLGKGIMTFFTGEDSLEDTIQTTPVENLDILYHGPESLNPSETLNNQKFSELLDTLCQQYDRILIDSPPVGPVADSRILAAITDAVILVLRAGKSTRKGSLEASEHLLSVDGNILGVVVNDVQRRHGGYGYGSYGYGYGYGNDIKTRTQERTASFEPASMEQNDTIRTETSNRRKLKLRA